MALLPKTTALASIMLACLSGCGGEAGSHSHPEARTIKIRKPFAGQYPIKALGTTGMVADLVRNVAGSHVKVDQLLAADVDPHTYKPTTADVSKIGQADLVIYSGLHLEGKMGEIFERMGRKIPTFPVAEFLTPEDILEDQDKAHDPHVWFDVALWSKTAGVVREIMEKFDPNHAKEYAANTEKYQAELARLHQYAREQIGTIPSGQRVLITSHDAFRYFGKAYGIEVQGIQGISTESEASVKDISNLVDFICRRQVKAVFVETSVNQRNMKSLIEGCQARNHQVVIGGELFSDAMGKEGTPEGTYVGMIKHNVDTIVNALK